MAGTQKRLSFDRELLEGGGTLPREYPASLEKLLERKTCKIDPVLIPWWLTASSDIRKQRCPKAVWDPARVSLPLDNLKLQNTS